MYTFEKYIHHICSKSSHKNAMDEYNEIVWKFNENCYKQDILQT